LSAPLHQDILHSKRTQTWKQQDLGHSHGLQQA